MWKSTLSYRLILAVKALIILSFIADYHKGIDIQPCILSFVRTLSVVRFIIKERIDFDRNYCSSGSNASEATRKTGKTHLMLSQ